MIACTAIVVVSHKSSCDSLDETTPLKIALAKVRKLRRVNAVQIATTSRLKPHLQLDEDEDSRHTVPEIITANLTPQWWKHTSTIRTTANAIRQASKLQGDLLLIAAEYPLLSGCSLNGLLLTRSNCYAGTPAAVWTQNIQSPEDHHVFSGAILLGTDPEKQWLVNAVPPHEGLCVLDPRSRRLLIKARELGYTE